MVSARKPYFALLGALAASTTLFIIGISGCGGGDVLSPIRIVPGEGTALCGDGTIDYHVYCNNVCAAHFGPREWHQDCRPGDGHEYDDDEGVPKASGVRRSQHTENR